MKDITIRHAEPSDYQPIISALNDWWGGRNMSDTLPKLFFVHFRGTNEGDVAENNFTFLVHHGKIKLCLDKLDWMRPEPFSM